MSARSDAATFLRLTREEQRLVVRALLWLPLISLGLRLFGYGRVQGFLARKDAEPRSMTDAAARARSAARLVAAAARRSPTRPTCLPTALTLQWLLRRQGIATDLRLGVRRREGKIEAHAWVEHQGEPLAGLEDGTAFAPLEDARVLP